MERVQWEEEMERWSEVHAEPMWFELFTVFKIVHNLIDLRAEQLLVKIQNAEYILYCFKAV